MAVIAHALAVRETLGQCQALGVALRLVVLAAGGAATLSGWLLGTAIFGAPWHLEAFAVSRPSSETAAQARKLASEAASLIGYPFDHGAEAVVNDAFLGPGYGIPSPEGQNAIVAAARAEGAVLDPTFTGKAMAGYLDGLSKGRYSGAGATLFIHTGGAPSLFTAAAEAMA